MFRNYFKTAWRNLRKHKSSSAINISGLAVGMAVALLIGLWIYSELSYNKNFDNYNRIARVMQHQTYNGITYSDQAMPYPIGKELQTVYAGNFKQVVMASWERDGILTYGDKNLSQHGIYMDEGAPAMLSLKMLQGNHTALKDPHSIIISATAAKAIFGDESPLNRQVKIDSKLDVTVTGVYENIPTNADFQGLNYISTWKLYTTSEEWVKNARDQSQWDNNSFQCFAQIADNTTFSAVSKNIVNAKLVRIKPEDKKFHAQVYLHPMSDWHLRSHWDDNGIQTGGAITYAWLFAIVGIFVLLLACINFMNLSTARSEKRAKETGIRKAVGSLRSQLISQFYCESLLVVIFAFFTSITLTLLALPWFNQVAAKNMSIPWTNLAFWVISIVFIVITSLLAGSYPALYLSSFKPVQVLKGTFRAGRFASIPRKSLVIVQFTISLVLIIATIVVYNQVQYSKDRPTGYNRNGLMMIAMKSPDFYGKFDMLESELKKSGAVTTMAESSSPVTGIWATNGGFSWQGKDPNLNAAFATIWVTHDFGKTVGWQFKEGRDFSKQYATDSLAIVINEAAVKFMNVKDPVGKMIEWDRKSYQVIGVIKDMLMESPYKPVTQTAYFMNYENANWINLKLNPANSISSSVSKIEAVFKKQIPSAPFDYKFADTEFAAKFAAEERIGTLSTFFAAFAIFISCLGLFGLASFVAEQRTKEIGVRKVLGASVFNLWKLLSKEFILLVMVSFIIAVPLSWYFMNNWLHNYQYRTNIYWWIFAVAGIGALLITVLTVSFQAIKAALANPVKSLRTE